MEIVANKKHTEIDVRSSLVDILKKDLLGPNQIDEALSDPPAQAYICGVLFPQGTSPSSESDDERSAGENDSETDSDLGIPVSENPILPSSIGLTFAVAKEVEDLKVHFEFATYKRVEQVSDTDTPKTTSKWQRMQHSGDLLLVMKGNQEIYSLTENAYLDWYVREEHGHKVVTIFLVNGNMAPAGKEGSSDDLCLFQPLVRISSDTTKEPILAREEVSFLDARDPDIENYQLLYSGNQVFGVGHGCSAEWAQTTSERTSAISTCVIPQYEVPLITAKKIGLDQVPGLSMATIANASSSQQVFEDIYPMIRSYSDWIEQREIKDLPLIHGRLRERATENLKLCKQAVTRMNSGLELIKANDEVWRAFQFANASMLQQRLRTVWIQRKRKGETDRSFENFALIEPGPNWRPFQLAFILMCIPEIFEPSLDERRLVDLLWFPTGGGKTEAYLGLAAFTMGLRRLRRNATQLSGDGGVTVLMRYTLRLLTIQQFQRASSLICACESIRKRDSVTWGSQSFSIGLWVGQKATPNNIDEADQALQEINQKLDKYKGTNPMQLLSCPWCGEALNHRNYAPDLESRRLTISCANRTCEFTGGLPVLVVDEEIYTRCPDLLISTVDKFAALPRQPKTSALFGRVTRFCERHGYLVDTDDSCGKSHKPTEELPAAKVSAFVGFLPPELIIQDELHLISGPLGTLVGLYEFALERLSSHSKVAPAKIIASTATIRRAPEQVAGLFARGLFQFPPPALNASDSFFAHESKESPGRLYVGIWTPGKSGKTSSIRIISSLLNAVQNIDKTFSETEPSEIAGLADPYSTLVAYFNSLRDLGGNLRLAADDIPQRLKLLNHGKEAEALRYEELTSRLSSDEIPVILRRMETPSKEEDGLDILHATNMISVGVDVDRLGLMVVHGQPKGTSEYIQATSRVGRSANAPGLVITRYNWNRPRDTDHYERFQSYHSMLYRFVEATSVTPLSARALDKGAHAVLYSLVRHLQSSMMSNSSANQFAMTSESTELIEWIVERAKETNLLNAAEIANLRHYLIAILQEWSDRITTDNNLRYHTNRFDKLSIPEKRQVLMKRLEEKLENSRVTLTSLRDVERNATLFYVEGN